MLSMNAKPSLPPRTRRSLRRALPVLALALLLAACAVEPTKRPRGQVTGSVSWPGGALPAGSWIILQVRDGSLADAPVQLPAELRIIAGGKNPPVDFELGYYLQDIRADRDYLLSGRIQDGEERVLYQMPTAVRAFEAGNPLKGLQLNFAAVAPQRAPPATP